MSFEVKVLRQGGGADWIPLDAVDENNAIAQAESHGHAVIAVRRKSAGIRFASRRTGFSLVLFSQELLALLKAGLSLVEAMEALAEKEHRSDTRSVLEGINSRLYEGQPLSSALGHYPGIFPPLYVATVRASERTGALAEALARYVAYQTQLDSVRKKVTSAAIYPVLLMAVGGLVTIFLIAYVVPRFSTIYENGGRDIPFLSRLLMSWGHLLQAHGGLVLAAALALGSLAGYLLSRPSLRTWIVRRLWKIPFLGERMHVYQLARFYRTLGMLLRGGIPIVASLDMVVGLLPSAMQARLQKSVQAIREGSPISVAMENHQLTTPVAVRMLRVGERTGEMGEMMERLAMFYDEEIARWVEWFARLFEPLLMAFIGLVIGGIVILLYLPIFELAGNLQ